MSVTVEHQSLVNRAVAASPSATSFRVLAILFAVALTAASAQISVTLPFTSVPFTMQPMVVLLVGAALGARLGATAQAAYLMLGVIGLPVFAASPLLPQGAARLLGPTGGYLLSYPLAAFVVGSLAERGWDRRYFTSALAMLAGLVVIYAGGLSWLAWLSQSVAVAFAQGIGPFVLADLLKVTAAAMILPQAWKLLR